MLDAIDGFPMNDMNISFFVFGLLCLFFFSFFNFFHFPSFFFSHKYGNINFGRFSCLFRVKT